MSPHQSSRKAFTTQAGVFKARTSDSSYIGDADEFNSNPAIIRETDTSFADMIPFARVPAMLPRSTRSGKRMSPACVYRWHQRGLNGVKLRALKVGGVFYTSRPWLALFFENVTAAGATGGDQQQHHRDRGYVHAEKLLDAAGIA